MNLISKVLICVFITAMKKYSKNNRPKYNNIGLLFLHLELYFFFYNVDRPLCSNTLPMTFSAFLSFLEFLPFCFFSSINFFILSIFSSLIFLLFIFSSIYKYFWNHLIGNTLK